MTATARAAAPMELDKRRTALRASLVSAGLLIETGVDGVYGRGAELESVVTALDAVVAAAVQEVHGDAATHVSFPPVMPRELLDRTDYIASFPQLSALVATYEGGESEHRVLLAQRAAGNDWGAHLRSSDIAMVPAACHPVYPTLTGVLPRDGVWIEVGGYCFRREPSVDPFRLQSFRMHEVVRVGSDRAAVAHRDSWIARADELLTSLGLVVQQSPAVDQFFGRAGRLIKANQSAEALKTELTVDVYGPDAPRVAIASSNYHRDRFGSLYGIETAEGGSAHSACVGFGIERIALALFVTHGMQRDEWPDEVSARL